MKKKNYFYLAALSLAMTFSMGACSDNDDPTPDGCLLYTSPSPRD